MGSAGQGGQILRQCTQEQRTDAGLLLAGIVQEHAAAHHEMWGSMLGLACSITERKGRHVPERLSETATPVSSYMFCPKSNYLSFSLSMMLQQYKVYSRHVSGFTCNHTVVAYNYRFSGLLIQCFVICIDSHKNVCKHVIVLYWALSVSTSWAIDPKWNYCLAHYMSYFEELFHDLRNRNRIGCFAGSHTHSITSDLHTHIP